MARTSDGRGFTIIEVMLFLAISGLMVAGMFIGISGSINRQRYEDAVYSFQDYMQSQYNLVDNVRNNRSDSVAGCDGGSRGTSNCAIVGRLVTTTDGRNFISEPVFARNSTPDPTGNVTELLGRLQLTTANTATDNENHQLAWGTRIYTDRAHPDASNTSQLLVLRMPTSGVVRTFFRTTPGRDLASGWSSATQLALCVEPDGLIKSNALGVRVLVNAINTNSVQFISAGAGVC